MLHFRLRVVRDVIYRGSALPPLSLCLGKKKVTQRSLFSILHCRLGPSPLLPPPSFPPLGISATIRVALSFAFFSFFSRYPPLPPFRLSHHGQRYQVLRLPGGKSTLVIESPQATRLTLQFRYPPRLPRLNSRPPTRRVL